MRKHALLAASLLALTACSSKPAATPPAQAPPPVPAAITVTAKSPEAVEHFKKGQELLDNLRTTEAAAEFDQALKLDGGFLLAHAYHGLSTPGPDGLKELETAAAAAGSLPEPERVLIEAATASRRGEQAKATAAFARLAELVPGDWRAHYSLGQQLLTNQKYADAVSALKKATSLNANAGGAQNMLGYAALRQGDAEGAIAAFEEYARLMPQEPNPQDSLGEALLGAGRFKESEAAFQKALALSPGFWTAHEGVAYARLYTGDWAGGRDALNQAKAAATQRTDKISVDDELAAVAMAQHDTAGAMRILDGIEKTAGAQPSDIAFVPLRRAFLMNDAGRSREALAQVAAALKTADGGQVGPGLSRSLRRQALVLRVAAETQMKDVAAATKTSEALDAAAAASAGDPLAQSAMHYGRGMLAVAKRDAAGARAHFDACSPEDAWCKWQGVVTAEKAGDKAGAETARVQLLKIYGRDPLALVVRSRLAPASAKRTTH
ncbi:MAG: tetratricopeptide repeat protein [Vicinamibacterales bacterium]